MTVRPESGQSRKLSWVVILSCICSCRALLSKKSSYTLEFFHVFPVSDISQTHLLHRIHENRGQRCKTNQSLRTAASPAFVGKCSAFGWCEMIVERWVVHGSWLVHGVIYAWMLTFSFTVMHGHSILAACHSWRKERDKCCWNWLIEFLWIPV